jgi:hypothetical protein
MSTTSTRIDLATMCRHVNARNGGGTPYAAFYKHVLSGAIRAEKVGRMWMVDEAEEPRIAALLKPEALVAGVR